MLKCVNFIEIRSYAYLYASSFLVLYYHIFCCNMFVFACSIIAKSQCWLFAIRGNYPYLPSHIRICPHMSVFARVFNFRYLHCGLKDYILCCQSTRKDLYRFFSISPDKTSRYCDLPKTLIFEWKFLFDTTYIFELFIPFQVKLYSNMLTDKTSRYRKICILYIIYIYIIYRFYTDFSLFRQIKRQDNFIQIFLYFAR
jgi:hypothetical protein